VAEAAKDPALGRGLVLDELFDLSLYRALRPLAPPDLGAVLDGMIEVETRHLAFWQAFFGLPLSTLDLGRRLKLALLVGACRVLGAPAIQLVLEAIEVHGVRKYLRVWQAHEGTPLEAALRQILEDEFRHEDAMVTGDAARRLSPERVRNIFLGLNDGLVEIVGAVSGFFAAFGDATTVLIAGATVAAAGAISMGAGAFVATSSEAEVQQAENARRRFLGSAPAGEGGESALGSGLVVGASYLAGALVPVLPIVLGAQGPGPSLLAAGSLIVLVSMLLAFLSGMRIRRRIAINLVIMAAAVGITYLIGLATQALWGIAV
jgi:VIT1/CCC1 family predicted Fe2+/Mn2+ transporter